MTSMQLAGGSGAGAPPLPPVDMADLVKRVADTQDRGAFRTLYASFGPRVKALMLRQGADAATAEEIAQETLLAVWRKAGLYVVERGSATSWIFTIARNLRIDRLRREVPWQEYIAEEHDEASDAPLPDDAVAARQIAERMRGVLDALPPDQVEVVTLAYVDGLSHSEIAARLRLPLGTVKSRMRLAYQKIRSCFEDHA